MRTLLFSLLLSLPALAAYAETPDALIDRGLGLREQGKDVEALALFEEAYARGKAPKALAQIALAEQALGRWIEAEAHLGAALESKDKWIAQRRKPLAGALDAIRERLADLEVLGSPAGARVLVNGKEAGALPLAKAVRVVAGAVVIDVVKDGFRPISRQIEVKPRSLARETIDLVPALATGTPTPSPPPPPSALPPPAPPPPLVAQSAPPPAEEGTSLAPLAIGTAAGAGVGLVVGTVGLLLRAGRVNAYNDDSVCLAGGRTRDENCGNELDAAGTFGALAVGGFVTAGVLAAASAVLFVLDE